jgi:hypothetical protein
MDGDPGANAAYVIAPNLKASNQLLRLICEHSHVQSARSSGGSSLIITCPLTSSTLYRPGKEHVPATWHRPGKHLPLPGLMI